MKRGLEMDGRSEPGVGPRSGGIGAALGIVAGGTVAGMVAVALLASATAGAAPRGKPAARTDTVKAGKMTLTVGKPVVSGNLTVFPVYSTERRQVSSDYLTLEEALKGKMIVVKELPDAEVNRVSVTSMASRPIYLMAGDIILGGQQDREVAHDTIVPGNARNLAVEVFCVEHGRWEGAGHFEGNEVASGSLRRETQQYKEQQKVWDKVASEATNMKAQTSSGTYRAVAGGKATQREIGSYVTPLGQALARDSRVLGVVVAVNGRVTAADIFADHKLFAQQASKILKSYALDAVQEKGSWTKQPPSSRPKPKAGEALQLLRDAERGSSRDTAKSATTLNSERSNESTVVFDTTAQGAAGGAGPARPAGAAPAHRNAYRKKN